MTQSLFEFEQGDELARVGGDIAPLIREFLEWKKVDGQFHASELYQYCLRAKQFLAPGSSCRVLRDMKAKKLVDYEIVKRSESKYRITKLDF